MADFKRIVSLQALHPLQTPIGNTIARKPATRFAIHQQCKGQDRIFASGMRPLCQWGTWGSDEWVFPQDTPVDTPQTDPKFPDDIKP